MKIIVVLDRKEKTTGEEGRMMILRSFLTKYAIPGNTALI
jgi:hypothetical protein